MKNIFYLILAINHLSSYAYLSCTKLLNDLETVSSIKFHDGTTEILKPHEEVTTLVEAKIKLNELTGKIEFIIKRPFESKFNLECEEGSLEEDNMVHLIYTSETEIVNIGLTKIDLYGFYGYYLATPKKAYDTQKVEQLFNRVRAISSSIDLLKGMLRDPSCTGENRKKIEQKIATETKLSDEIKQEMLSIMHPPIRSGSFSKHPEYKKFDITRSDLTESSDMLIEKGILFYHFKQYGDPIVSNSKIKKSK